MTVSEPMKVLDLFSGIGGFSLGLERAGMETIAYCEYDEPCRKVLKKHWPDIPIYEDVRNVTKERLNADGIFPDVITGGFPCQDISVAGKQAGIGEGTRSGLWSECARILGEFRPSYAIFENVTALLSGDKGRWFQRVLWDISQVGYDAEWHCVPASELGAHHHRDRVWIVAYPRCEGIQQRRRLPNAVKKSELANGVFRDGLQAVEITENETLADPEPDKGGRIFSGREIARAYSDNRGDQGIWQAEPDVGRVANGIPNRSHRLKQLGNAVVPQIPELIGRAIMAQAHKKAPHVGGKSTRVANPSHEF